MTDGFCPFAKNLNIPPGSNDPGIKPRLAILHVDAGNASSLHDYFNGPSGGIESHFFVKKDGSIEQYRSIYFQADANLDANDFAVSIETQGYGEGEWTDEQIASIKRLLLWLHAEAGIPLVKVDKWDGSGVGYHTQFGAPSHWTPVSKSCPGPDRIKQFNAVLVPWMKTALKPTPPKVVPTPPKQPTPPEEPKPKQEVVRLVAAVRAAKTAGWARRIGNVSVRNDAKVVKAALVAEGVKSYADWQRECGVTPVNGVPDLESLTALGRKHNFKVDA